MADGPTAPTPPVGDRFAYLLKHARERLSAIQGTHLEPLGINGRELAVLSVLAQGPPPSQLEAAQRLKIDRTSMVGLLDGLEEKGLVQRGPDPEDRRRNIVALTAKGTRTLIDGTRAADAAEQEFLHGMSPADADRLRRLLKDVATE